MNTAELFRGSSSGSQAVIFSNEFSWLDFPEYRSIIETHMKVKTLCNLVLQRSHGISDPIYTCSLS